MSELISAWHNSKHALSFNVSGEQKLAEELNMDRGFSNNLLELDKLMRI